MSPGRAKTPTIAESPRAKEEKETILMIYYGNNQQFE
jgi:hypothetical protein